MKILIREVRKQKGLTLVELAKRSGYGKSTISNFENEIVSPTILELEAIATVLGVKISDLFDSEFK